MLGSSVLGMCELSVQDIIDDGVINKKLKLLNSRKQEDKPRGKLHIMTSYGSESQLPPISPRGNSPRGGDSSGKIRSGTLPSTKKEIEPKPRDVKSSDDIALQDKKKGDTKKKGGSARKSSKVEKGEDKGKKKEK